ncbi:MAG TPA: hypothetical protein VHE78_15315 [Gemmatimonadaceae bacterium]|nr:hypothetical protein [Gemmatimonadaceae bacterium]
MPAVVLLAALWGGCTNVSTSATRAVAIEFDSLPFPAVVTSDSLRDSTGRAAALHALAFNSSGGIIPGAPIQYIALDTGITIGPGGFVTAQSRGGAIRIVAIANGLQSVTRTLAVARRPDTVIVPAATDTTLRFTIPDSAAKNVTAMLTVKVVTRDTAGGVTGTNGWLVSYQAFYHGMALSRRDTSLASLWDSGTNITTVDTTKAPDGRAGRRLRVRSLSLPTQLDSFIVKATVRYRGKDVAGSPVRFIIRTLPR